MKRKLKQKNNAEKWITSWATVRVALGVILLKAPSSNKSLLKNALQISQLSLTCFIYRFLNVLLKLHVLLENSRRWLLEFSFFYNILHLSLNTELDIPPNPWTSWFRQCRILVLRETKIQTNNVHLKLENSSLLFITRTTFPCLVRIKVKYLDNFYIETFHASTKADRLPKTR